MTGDVTFDKGVFGAGLISALDKGLNSVGICVLEQNEQLVEDADDESCDFQFVSVDFGYHFWELLAGLDVKVFDVVTIGEDDAFEHDVVNIWSSETPQNLLLHSFIFYWNLSNSFNAERHVLQKLNLEVAAH